MVTSGRRDIDELSAARQGGEATWRVQYFGPEEIDRARMVDLTRIIRPLVLTGDTILCSRDEIDHGQGA